LAASGFSQFSAADFPFLAVFCSIYIAALIFGRDHPRTIFCSANWLGFSGLAE
jgi:hypothetical protein